VQADHIIDSPDVESVYQIPEIFNEQHFDALILEELGLPAKSLQLSQWNTMVKTAVEPKKKTVRVAIVGKYLATGDYQLKDSYAALIDAINHASVANEVTTDIVWVDAAQVEKLLKANPTLSNEDLKQIFGELNGLIVPIGWGERGVEGKIRSIQFAREEKIPYLGLCYGMQLAAVEYARHVLGWADAHTTEVDPQTTHPVIHIIPEQERILENRSYGGSMRLGAWDCIVKPDTLAWSCYDNHGQFIDKNKGLTSERHRHRYEFNDAFTKDFEDSGVTISGRSVKENLAELIELPKSEHPFFLGTQGHPEYKSRPLKPHGIFVEFLKAAVNK
jgi:CTP synthase